jgi:hypothetical protein
MTLAEILQQANALSGPERKELVKLLVDSLDVPEAPVSSGVYLNCAGWAKKYGKASTHRST